MLPCWEKSGVSAEALCALCEYDAYCSSRLHMNMYLFTHLTCTKTGREKLAHSSSKSRIFFYVLTTGEVSSLQAHPILLTDVFATDIRWFNSTILSKTDTFVFNFCYCWIVLNFLLLHHILHAICLRCALYCTDMNLHFLQPEAYSFHFWCERKGLLHL